MYRTMCMFANAGIEGEFSSIFYLVMLPIGGRFVHNSHITHRRGTWDVVWMPSHEEYRVALYDEHMCRDSCATKCQFMLLYGFYRLWGAVCMCVLERVELGVESKWLHGYAFCAYLC